MNAPYVEMRGIVKCFPGVRANVNVSFDVMRGEVHALLGENGAGKSTLMRQLYGLYPPDEGDILVDGKRLVLRSPADAIKAGIGMIHQHFMLVPTLSVAQNVALGQRSQRAPLLDLKRVAARIVELAAEYGLKVDPHAFVWQLSVGEQQRVEIMKTLYRGAQVIILDEPTAVLTPREVDDLFATLHRMAREGHSLIFISHKLQEVSAISDRVTVLRAGSVIGTRVTREATQAELVRMMVGHEIADLHARPREPGPVVLAVGGLHAMGDRGTEALRGIDLKIHAGEIVGLAGVSGNGQRELAECLAGIRRSTQGSILLRDADVTHDSLNRRVAAGMAFIPEERMRDGAIRDFSVRENIFLRDHSLPRFSRGIFLRSRRMEAHAATLVEQYAVKTPGLDTPLKNLSGGNIQKLIMARELSRRPSLLIAAQPTRGVDIGATSYIHQQLLQQRDEGIAILLVSEDLDEILTLSDRVVVIYEGRIVGEAARGQMTRDQIGLMMAGITTGEA